MVLAQEAVGPYTVGLAIILLAGLPVTAKLLKRSTRLQWGNLSAQLGDTLTEVSEQATVAAKAATEAASSVNGVVPGEPKLIDQVRVMGATVAGLADGHARIEGQLVGLHDQLATVEGRQLAFVIAISNSDAVAQANGVRIEQSARLQRDLATTVDQLCATVDQLAASVGRRHGDPDPA